MRTQVLPEPATVESLLAAAVAAPSIHNTHRGASAWIPTTRCWRSTRHGSARCHWRTRCTAPSTCPWAPHCSTSALPQSIRVAA